MSGHAEELTEEPRIRNVIRWETPPAPKESMRSVQSKWYLVRRDLRDNPGRWALVAEGDTCGTDAFRGPDGFECVQRNFRTVDGSVVSDIYARWVP